MTREQQPPAPVVARVPKTREFLARYLRGEYGVWDELLENAGAVQQHPDLRAEAKAVATEIMKRVRHNVDVLRHTLREAGAQVAEDDPPPSDEDIDRIVAYGGPIPIALEAFWQVCGSVVLLPGGDDSYDYGRCSLEADGLSLIALDPLELRCDPDDDIVMYEDQISESRGKAVVPFELSMSADHLHKQNISGGAPHTILLPARTDEDAVDPVLHYTRYGTRFVEYLRIAFRYGGFPGLDVADVPLDRVDINDRYGFEGVTGSWSHAAARLLAKLRRDLVEL